MGTRAGRTAVAVAVAAGSLAAIGIGPPSRADVLVAARHAEAVVMTGADLTTWSRLPAEGTPAPYPSGTATGERDAHNGTIQIPPDPRGEGVPVEEIAAYRWNGKRFVEIPVQVDERFPHFLANGNSDFGVYSGTDTELTYA